MKPTTTEAAICCMIVSNPCGGMRPHGWQKRVNDLIRAQDQELATLRAERDDARKVSDRWASEAVVLRASEAAALARVTTALEIAQTRHIPDQPAAYGGSELEWAQRQYASLRRDIIAALTPTADKEPKT